MECHLYQKYFLPYVNLYITPFADHLGEKDIYFREV